MFCHIQVYRALYDYHPLKGDELRLQKGDLYTVIEKCEDGWFKGSSLNTLKTGVFPGNYMQHVRDEKQNAFATNSPAAAAATTPAASSRTTAASTSSQQQKVWQDVTKPKSGDLVRIFKERLTNNTYHTFLYLKLKWCTDFYIGLIV